MYQETIQIWAEVTKPDNKFNLFFSPGKGIFWHTIDPKYFGIESSIWATESLIEKLDTARAIAVNYLYKLKNPKVEDANAN
jgi:hypothetical protein